MPISVWLGWQFRKKDCRIVELEHAGEDLEAIAWSVGCDLYETYGDSNFPELEEKGQELKNACDKFHIVFAGEPLTKTEK